VARSAALLAVMASGCVYTASIEAELLEPSAPDATPDASVAVDAAEGPPDLGFVDAGVPGFSYIPPGRFTMGSPESEPGRGREGDRISGDERAHEVTLTRGYLVKDTEVTQAEWAAVMGSAPSSGAACPECPVESVSWWDALAWCNARSRADGLTPCYWLVACTGTPGLDLACEAARPLGYGRDPQHCQGYRLPTEAEWERAARAGTRTAVWTGDLSDGLSAEPLLRPIAWYADETGGVPHPVGEKTPNPWGLYDVAGNVDEWVWDWIGAYGGAATDPLGLCADGACTGPGRVLRGGAFDTDAAGLRHAARTGLSPVERAGNVGFRVARTANAPEYRLGDRGPAGGLVFYDKGLYSDGWRYMEAAPSDQGTAPWGCSGTAFEARASEAGGGLENTRRIVEGCAERTAAQIAAEYDLGGVTDWFLPGIIALSAMYRGLHEAGLGGFRGAPRSSAFYWTSQETVVDFGWYLNFADGNEGAFAKTAALRVRPVRRF
jgi:formylglycine-generating enzyme required for sulfatase activity